MTNLIDTLQERWKAEDRDDALTELSGAVEELGDMARTLSKDPADADTAKTLEQRAAAAISVLKDLNR
jgi:hypothetical protein